MNCVYARATGRVGWSRMVTTGTQGSRWCLLKRMANLTPRQRPRPRHLLRYYLKTVSANLLKEDFQNLEPQLAHLAGEFLDQWCHDVMRTHGADEENRRHATQPP